MKRTIVLGGLAVTNIVVSLLTQWYILTTIGVGFQTDAHVASMVVPQLVLAVLGGSLSNVLVTVFSSGDTKSLSRRVWSILTLVTGLFFVIAVLLGVLAEAWLPFLVPGFSGSSKALAAKLCQIQLFGMFLGGITAVLAAVYQAQYRVLRTESAILAGSTVGFVMLLWTLPFYGIVAAAWLSVLRISIQLFVMISALNLKPMLDFRDPILFVVWSRIKPLVLGTAIYKTGPVVDTFLGSLVPSGGLSLLVLAQQMYGAAHQGFLRTFVAQLTPALARAVIEKNWGFFRRATTALLVKTSVGVGAVFAITFGIGYEMLNAVLAWKFPPAQILMLWWLLLALGGMWAGGAVGPVLTATFYARGDTSTPMRIGVRSFFLSVVIKVVACSYLGIVGVALGASVFYMLNLVLLARAFISRRPQTN